jgi:hypothetical protein
MDAAAIAERPEADGVARQAQRVFRTSRSQPVGGVIERINPIVRGWVKYFAIGHSSRCFSYIRSWVETRIRRHLARACRRRGFGWKRWSREWLYETPGLFSEYRVSGPESSELIRQEGFSENFWKPATVFHPGPVTPARAGPNSELRRRKDWRWTCSS